MNYKNEISNKNKEVDDIQKYTQSIIQTLPKDFNVWKEPNDLLYLVPRRINTSLEWTPFLLKMTLYINILIVLILLTTTIIIFFKPQMKIYAATPNGHIYPIKQVYIDRTSEGEYIHD
jgi:hypothetical protein